MSKATTNLGLFEYENTDADNINTFNIDVALNENWDKIDTKTKSIDDKVDTINNNITSLSSGKGASLIGLNDSANQFTATNVEGALSELFINATNGQKAVATELIARGMSATTSDTYTLLASKIKAITFDASKLLTGNTVMAIAGTMVNRTNTWSDGKPDLYVGNGFIGVMPLEGYYPGTGVGSGGTMIHDLNFISDNIKANKSIFGIVGKSTVVDTSDATVTGASQLLSGVSAYGGNGLKFNGTMLNRATMPADASHVGLGDDTSPLGRFEAFRTWTGTKSIFLGVPSGYYDGDSWIYAIDPNFISDNIKAGKSIFGLAGKSTVVDTSDSTITSAGQVLAGIKVHGVAGDLVTGTMPNNGAINRTPTTSSQSIPSGFTTGGTVGAVIVPVAKVLNDTTIAGITGTMSNNGALNYIPSASVQTIPAGYTLGGTVGTSAVLAGTTILISDSVASSTGKASPTKLKEYHFMLSGTVRVTFYLSIGSGQSSYAQIYKNGSPIGTLRSTNSTSNMIYTEDISISSGDYIQLYAYCTTSSEAHCDYMSFGIVAIATKIL